MCQFISWIESKDGPLFLTDCDLDDKSLRDAPNKDKIGHGAIKAFYGLLDSTAPLKERETPYPLPPEIIKALRAGKMDRMMDIGGYSAFVVDDRGLLHRDDGPAVEYTNGTKAWYRDGKLYREGGLAVESPYGRVCYIDGLNNKRKVK